MRVLLDSSALIAAMLSDHIHHLPAHAWLSRAKSGAFEFIASGHSISEVYSVLTRLPRTPRISAAEAWQMLRENVIAHAKILTLSGDDYQALLEDLSRRGILGGLVYDGIIAKVAELAQVDRLVTVNLEHFQKVWPPGIDRIMSALAAPD